jgi:hypothetical protein
MLLCSQVGIAEQFLILLIIIIIIIIIIQLQTESNLRVPHYSTRTAALVPALDLILILISRGYLASNRYLHHRFSFPEVTLPVTVTHITAVTSVPDPLHLARIRTPCD